MVRIENVNGVPIDVKLSDIMAEVQSKASGKLPGKKANTDLNSLLCCRITQKNDKWDTGGDFFILFHFFVFILFFQIGGAYKGIRNFITCKAFPLKKFKKSQPSEMRYVRNCVY